MEMRADEIAQQVQAATKFPRLDIQACYEIVCFHPPFNIPTAYINSIRFLEQEREVDRYRARLTRIE